MVCKPCIPFAGSLKKPDILASKGSETVIISSQTSSDRVALSAAHENKCSYYSTLEVLQGVWEMTGKDYVGQVSYSELAWDMELGELKYPQGVRAFIPGPRGVFRESPNLDSFPLQDVIQESRSESGSLPVHLMSAPGLIWVAPPPRLCRW